VGTPFPRNPLHPCLYDDPKQNSGSACSRTPYSSHQRWLWPYPAREGNKRVHCIWDLHKALTNPCFRKQGATLANFMLWYQKIFAPIELYHWKSCKFLQTSGTLYLDFTFPFTGCYNSNVLPQFGMSQYNSLNVHRDRNLKVGWLHGKRLDS